MDFAQYPEKSIYSGVVSYQWRYTHKRTSPSASIWVQPEHNSHNKTLPCPAFWLRILPIPDFLGCAGIPKESMEDSYSVCSPRRILSVSKKRRATVSFVDSDDKASGFHGPKPSEVYGFVGSITTVVATVIFLVWAYVPESWLHSIGIFYYPSRYWALAVPAYAMMTVVLALGFYCGVNFMSTPPPSSLYTVYDEFSRDPLSSVPMGGDDQPIEPISDISIDRINRSMFK
ncbi:Phosphatidylinositol N-acetylglucosaminyltransferase, GPI19/PIG-P subunit [Prunus dulcis]|uniref:Phosphatidylinositol N-acetylglucosaminyltransferase, GPI19/PIG-P subunit n=3 Tax=Prunus TaxID=3754 RepID=A0A4Y1QZD5_PRUDU|nr:Phosphatidylinositol N-acetylglucosaminyltransferase, GPI19/PIG-P subunit [Prunus dulcis]